MDDRPTALELRDFILGCDRHDASGSQRLDGRLQFPDDVARTTTHVDDDRTSPPELGEDPVPPVFLRGGRKTALRLHAHIQLNVAAARHDLEVAARRLMAEHAGIGAIVLECTNMPPYQADIHRVAGVPVFSMVDYVCWLHAGIVPKAWSPA